MRIFESYMLCYWKPVLINKNFILSKELQAYFYTLKAKFILFFQPPFFQRTLTHPAFCPTLIPTKMQEEPSSSQVYLYVKNYLKTK